MPCALCDPFAAMNERRRAVERAAFLAAATVAQETGYSVARKARLVEEIATGIVSAFVRAESAQLGLPAPPRPQATVSDLADDQ